MIALKIEDVGMLTSGLFVKDMFDDFLLREAEIVTYSSFLIQGRIKSGYFTQEEAEENNIKEFAGWSLIKPFCFSLIKGKKLPSSFNIVLQASPEMTADFLRTSEINVNHENIKGLYLNIRYEGGNLTCVTGTSVNEFTLDKTLDNEWDNMAVNMIKSKGIAFSY